MSSGRILECARAGGLVATTTLLIGACQHSTPLTRAETPARLPAAQVSGESLETTAGTRLFRRRGERLEGRVLGDVAYRSDIIVEREGDVTGQFTALWIIAEGEDVSEIREGQVTVRPGSETTLCWVTSRSRDEVAMPGDLLQTCESAAQLGVPGLRTDAGIRLVPARGRQQGGAVSGRTFLAGTHHEGRIEPRVTLELASGMRVSIGIDEL